MSKKANLIMNILMILLILGLVFVMMSYYTRTPAAVPTNIDVIKNDIISGEDAVSIITNESEKKENLNDKIINIENSIEQSGDIKEEPQKTDEVITKNESSSQENPTLIITSENEISSKEKKEILTELDKTLMELLDIVDKVQTVDETRLIVDDSEVQE